MDSASIAWMNFRHNLRIYSLHMAVIIFSIAVYYNFAALRCNPELLREAAVSASARGASYAASFLLLVFIAFFIWSAGAFSLRQRKKEIAIYALIGIDNSQIGRVLALETLLQGITALAAGLLLGVLTGKLFMMLLAKAALLNIRIAFFFSWGSLIETSVIFTIIFVLGSLKGWWSVSRSRLINLLNASRIEERGADRSSYVKAVASIIMIAMAYCLCLKINLTAIKGNLPLVILMVVALVVAGSFWFFGSLGPLAISRLMLHKRWINQGVRPVAFANLAYRLRTNYRTMAAITVLIASAITALGTVSSMQYYVKDTFTSTLPYSFTYLNQVDDPVMQEKVNNMIEQSQHKILLNEKTQLLYTDKAIINHQSQNKELILVNYPDFIRVIKDLQVGDYDKPVRILQPAPGEAVYVVGPGVLISMTGSSGNAIQLGDINLIARQSIKIPFLGAGVPGECLIVNDADYQALRQSLKTYYFYGLRVDRPDDTWDLAMDLKSIKPLNNSLFSYAEGFEFAHFREIGVFYFVGVFLALVFLLATGSVMFFKSISDAMSDRDKYVMLSHVGMTGKEISQAVAWQVGISFALPLLLGSMHAATALYTLHLLMNYNLLVPAAISMGVFTLIYGLFAWLTTHKFLAVMSS